MTELMDNNYEFFEDSTYSESDIFSNSEFILEDASFFVAIHQSNHVNCYHGKLNHSSTSFFHLLTENYEKERFYVKAIKNLLKQKRYLNLMYEYSHELISEQEFNKELEENESNYLIEANERLDSLNAFSSLVKVLGNIGESLSEEDLTEMFSLEDPLTFKKLEMYHHSQNRNIKSGI